MREYQFELPFPPSVNAWKTPFRGRMILTKKGRDYRAAVIEQMEKINLVNKKLDCNLSVYIRMHGPTNAKRDIDNFLKSPLDALTHSGFWVDDSQIDKLTICRAEKIKGGKLVVTVKEI